MKCLRDRDFAWHHDIKAHTWEFICKLWQHFNPNCRISSLSPQCTIPLLPGPPLQASFQLTTCLLQLSSGWGVVLLPGDMATSQALFCFLTEAEPSWRKKCVCNTHQSPEVFMEIPCLQCSVQHSAHWLFNIRLNLGAKSMLFFIMHRSVL